MNRGIATIADILPVGLLADLQEQKQRDIAPVKAPVHHPPKVINDPTREPVNKQAAMMTARASWLCQPMPAETAPVSELEKLREDNARLLAANKNLTAENNALRRKLENSLKPAPRQIAVEPPSPKPVESPVKNPKLELLERLQNV